VQAIYDGIVGRGFQIASGQSVGGEGNPFSDGSLKMQDRHFRERGIDLGALVPGLFWGTINLKLGKELVLARADHVARNVDWTGKETGRARIAAETFSLIHCCFAYPLGGGAGTGYYPGLIYYPHPETKPTTNPHRFDVLEVLTGKVPNLVHGTPASLVCRADAFRPR
jgi:hypothetical protein